MLMVMCWETNKVLERLLSWLSQLRQKATFGSMTVFGSFSTSSFRAPHFSQNSFDAVTSVQEQECQNKHWSLQQKGTMMIKKQTLDCLGKHHNGVTSVTCCTPFAGCRFRIKANHAFLTVRAVHDWSCLQRMRTRWMCTLVAPIILLHVRERRLVIAMRTQRECSSCRTTSSGISNKLEAIDRTILLLVFLKTNSVWLDMKHLGEGREFEQQTLIVPFWGSE